MPSIEIRVPQLGEGLQEARIIRFLKQPGDVIKRDEPIYEMETDKAVMEVESPYNGVLQSWLAEEDEIVPIGAVVAKLESEEKSVDSSTVETVISEAVVSNGSVYAAETEASSGTMRNANIPPRTRAYAKEKGISEQILQTISSASGKLMPTDIDEFLASGSQTPADVSGVGYQDIPMTTRQRTLSYRLARTVQQVVPGTIEIPVEWETIEEVYSRVKTLGLPEEKRPSQFLLAAWCVARAMQNHPKFRSALLNESTVRQYDRANIGIAVAIPNDELVTAVVPKADSLSFTEFVELARYNINEARQGKDQASDHAVHVAITNMASFGLRTAVPVVVPPSIATLFIGAPYVSVQPFENGFAAKKLAHLVLTFDHRLINGVGAANFLVEIGKHIHNLNAEIPL